MYFDKYYWKKENYKTLHSITTKIMKEIAKLCKQKYGRDWKEHFMQMQVDQVTELMTNYGQIDYIWQDHHNDSEIWRRVDRTIRKLQPNCVIFGLDTWISGQHRGRAY